MRITTTALVWIALALSNGLCLLHAQAPALTPASTSLEAKLKAEKPADLVAAARARGDAARGAILFHGPLLGCARCHAVNQRAAEPLGPRLIGPLADQAAATSQSLSPQELGEFLVESILEPSTKMAAAYQPLRILTEDGKVIVGLAVPASETAATKGDGEETATISLRELATLEPVHIPRSEIVQQQRSDQSIMPTGLVNSLANRGEFLDLLQYLLEIRAGGEKRARELQPSAAQLAIQLPEYEADIDHAGMIRDWDDAALARGEEIYMGLCVNCHGTRTAPGSLATALRFGEGKFKHGSDPYSMYRTLTRGAGLMLPQPWMVPQQKYDVIHYLREAFLREANPSQLTSVDDAYLASLPKGQERGPAPQKIEPWSQADYGPRLAGTYEIGSGGRNIAYKGIAIQLDDAPGGVAHGDAWAIFDHDTMRVAGVWTSRGFIDWQAIHFNGRHGMHPHIVGDILLANPIGPGWADPTSGSLEDDRRVLGRDGKAYGPLPRQWAQFQGIETHGRHSQIMYRVGDTQVRESFKWLSANQTEAAPSAGLFTRQLQLGPRSQPLEVVVATLDRDDQDWSIHAGIASSVAADTTQSTRQLAWSEFDGGHYLEIADATGVNLFDQDFTIRAEIQTTADGTIFCRAPQSDRWAPGGQTLFVRDGRLSYDVGWVGAMQSQRRVADGKRHWVALRWDSERGVASLWIDGQRDAQKKLQPKQLLEEAVLRIGRTCADFPETSPLESGSIYRVQIFERALNEPAMQAADFSEDLLADWQLPATAEQVELQDAAGHGYAARRVAHSDANSSIAVHGVDSQLTGWEWAPRGSSLLLRIPAGTESAELTLWSAAVTDASAIPAVPQFASSLTSSSDAAVAAEAAKPALVFPEVIETTVTPGTDTHGFAVDVLQIPTANPWQARVRLTGLDFFSDPDRLAVCTWDGDVWIVSGLSQLDVASAADQAVKLQWRRIAYGLFQPLGLKIIDEQIYLTCRDQLVRLEDRDGDGAIDVYHCINNDHQVTEHFHEFAMGLQTDAAGNFYYAKSARHALTAIVPHHGTLLRVSKDGTQTDILATGFRAANGVCLNPDGTFIVTDQEGHWNPKNRINWVHEGGFYGNMYAYHDVTDDSDEAMEPPLCWITNAFDRSPAELLWVDSPAWGPLQGSLLNLSYGYGKVYVVPHEKQAGVVQGGMCQLPIDDMPTGLVRGRFSPHDRQLYVCGLSAWATNQMQQEGGLYRIRYTQQPAALPLHLAAMDNGLEITFSEPLSAETSRDPASYAVEVWGLKRSKNYGSDHYDQHALEITAVRLSEDRRRLQLELPGITPTRGMEVRLSVVDANGIPVERVIHNTIHRLP